MTARISGFSAIVDAKLCPPDWEEGTAVVDYRGAPLTVYYSAGELGIEVDGIEHYGLTLEADDLSDTMRESLARSLRAQFDREDA